MAISPAAQSASLTSPAASASTGVLLAASSARKGVIITNEGSTILYLAFAPTASLSAYTVQVPATNGQYVMDPSSVYGGVISGIWAGSPTGNARVTTW